MGNVVAHALRYAKNNTKNKDFKIKELILLEVPIINVTEEINNSQFVDTVYNIIVGKDLVQVLDVFSGNYPLCRRVFEQEKHLKLFNFYAKDAKGHNDIDSMIRFYNDIKKKDLELKKNSSEDCRKLFDLNGGWYVWHKYGKIISLLMPVILIYKVCKYFINKKFSIILDQKNTIPKDIKN